MRTYMASTLLRDTDSVSMARSLEVRVPLLERPLSGFCGSLPARRVRHVARKIAQRGASSSGTRTSSDRAILTESVSRNSVLAM